MATPTALALPEAMIRTLQDYLDAPLPTELAAEADPVGDLAHVTDGWERLGHDLVYPTVSIDAPVDGERVSSAPVPIVLVQPAQASDPTIEVYYHVGSVDTPLQLNVFAESKVQRAEVVHALEVALQGDVLNGAGVLSLDSSHYFNLPIAYRREGPFRYMDTEGSVGADEWRAVCTVIAESHEIARVQTYRFIDLSIDWRVARVNKIDDVAGEIVTYFEP
jgi:hypothetical protein